MNLGGLDPSRVVLLLVPMILSLTWHEFAHAFMAKRLGDRTAEEQGRLTLNPLAHVDPIGTLLIPAIGALSGIPLIGWARPVPVDTARFRRGVDRRRGYALVSAAGPFSNLLLAVLAAAALAFGGNFVAGSRGLSELCEVLLKMNVGLCIFNLLPIAPLDGSKLLPRSLDGFQRTIAPYSMIILMGILMVPALARTLIWMPVAYVEMAIRLIFGLL